jgi:hypothetical protein
MRQYALNDPILEFFECTLEAGRVIAYQKQFPGFGILQSAGERRECRQVGRYLVGFRHGG